MRRLQGHHFSAALSLGSHHPLRVKAEHPAAFLGAMLLPGLFEGRDVALTPLD